MLEKVVVGDEPRKCVRARTQRLRCHAKDLELAPKTLDSRGNVLKKKEDWPWVVSVGLGSQPQGR